MKYTTWDYSLNHVLNDKTKMGIYYLYKDSKQENIIQYLEWLRHNQPDFMFMHKDFIFSRLIEFKYFDIADSFFAIKPFQFDEKIANRIAGIMSIKFDQSIFDYWNNKIEELSPTEKHTIYKSFWPEFFSSQFTQFFRSAEFKKNINNLAIVFDKVPFYSLSETSLYISERKEFFLDNRLNEDCKEELLKEIGLLCAQYYPKKLVLVEFENYPTVIQYYNKFILNKNLNIKLEKKEESKKIKI